MIPLDYNERVYAGVLGKIIGVYLGRPFEGWTHERIVAELGEITSYVHARLNKPLIVTDDDISGTFTFLRALPDYANTRDLTPTQIGQTWLNYLIERKTILWWGGMGNSTEHTAYERLKNGIVAPRSGSMQLNGQVVSEQIGAQIFIDGWAMVAPGDPGFAADLARRAASVSHDGEAIYAAQVIAAMEAQAFIENDINQLFDVALRFIPRDCVIAQVIADVREWRAHDDDWYATRKRIEEKYGYAKYGGNCHVVPNHALIVLALAYAPDDFHRALMIVNTAGWDTDCNSANVGCLLGIKNGLRGIDASAFDFRAPVADRMFLVSADGGRCITDAAQETIRIVNVGCALQQQKSTAPKRDARFHFDFSGSLQGFHSDDARLKNVHGHSTLGERSLAIRFDAVAEANTATFIPPDARVMPGSYQLIASPTLYPGQEILAGVECDEDATVNLFVRAYGSDDQLTLVTGDTIHLHANQPTTLRYTPQVDGGSPIAQVGIQVRGAKPGTLYLDYLTWSGAPTMTLVKPAHNGTLWQRAWVNACDDAILGHASAFRVCHNSNNGLLIQGEREWKNFTVEAKIIPHLAKSAGIAACVQGLERYYALILCNDGIARLVKKLDGSCVLAEQAFEFQLDTAYTLSLTTHAHRLISTINQQVLFDVQDPTNALAGGAIALFIEAGRMDCDAVNIMPV